MDTDQLVTDAKREITLLIERGFTETANAAKAEAAALLEESKAELEVFGKLLANGEIDTEMYSSLVRMQLNLARIIALKHVGLTSEKAQKLALDIASIVIRLGIKAALASV